jgi:hypothetical protein
VNAPGGAIDAYLDRLFNHLAGTGGRGRRILAEAEDHLLQAVEEATAQGADPTAAEVEALARFGDTRILADAAQPQHGAAHRMVTTTWLLLGTTTLAYGVGGLLTWAARWPYDHLYTAWKNAGSGPTDPIYFASEPRDADFLSMCSGPTHRPCLVGHGIEPPGFLGIGEPTPFQALVVLTLAILIGLATLAPLRPGSRRLSANPPPILGPLVGLGGAVLFGIGVIGTAQGGYPGDPLQNLITGIVLAVAAALIRRPRRSRPTGGTIGA